jgi:hypothetical protein
VVEVDEIERVTTKPEPKRNVAFNGEPTVIKEVRPLKKVELNDDNDMIEEVDAAAPPAKIAAGGK